MADEPDSTAVKDSLRKAFSQSAAQRIGRFGQFIVLGNNAFRAPVDFMTAAKEKAKPSVVSITARAIIGALKKGSEDAVLMIVKGNAMGRHDMDATCAFLCKGMRMFARKGKNISYLMQYVELRGLHKSFWSHVPEKSLLRVAQGMATHNDGALENLQALASNIKNHRSAPDDLLGKIRGIAQPCVAARYKILQESLESAEKGQAFDNACDQAFIFTKFLKTFGNKEEIKAHARYCMNLSQTKKFDKADSFAHHMNCINYLQMHIDPDDFITSSEALELFAEYISNPAIECRNSVRLAALSLSSESVSDISKSFDEGYNNLRAVIGDPAQTTDYKKVVEETDNFINKHKFISEKINIPDFDFDMESVFADFVRQRIQAEDFSEALRACHGRNSKKFWDMIDEPLCLAMAKGLQQEKEISGLQWLCRVLVENQHPAAKSVQEISTATIPDRKPDPQALLAMAAPIVASMDDKAAQAAIKALMNAPHADVARAQADALQYIWAALEEADPDIIHMDKDGRADISFSAEKLHELYMDVSRYMGVAQLQTPIIVSDNVGAERFVDKIFSGMGWMSHEDRAVSEKFVGGSKSHFVYDSEKGHYKPSSFGFLTLRKNDGATPDDPQGVPRLIALPIITIDGDTLTKTMESGGEDILRAFQEMMAIFNHDYFHHQTARNIVPYFGGMFGNRGTLTRSETAYAFMLGKEKSLKGTKAGATQSHDSYGSEQTARFLSEKYHGTEKRWNNFGTKQPYEFHALHIQNVLYRDYLDRGKTGEKMRVLIDRYVDGVADMTERAAANGTGAREVNELKMYYANMLAFHLLRIVPYQHPLMAYAEDCIDRLAIDADFRQEQLSRRNGDWELSERKKKAPRTSADIVKMTGLSAEKLEDRSKMTVAEGVRLYAYFCAERIVNPIYLEKYREPQTYALAALRQVLSVVMRDMAMIRHRGGMETFEKIKHTAPEKPSPFKLWF